MNDYSYIVSFALIVIGLLAYSEMFRDKVYNLAVITMILSCSFWFPMQVFIGINILCLLICSHRALKG